MKPLKIGICVSGQSRTWRTGVESFRHYFSDSPDVKFYVFGHTWDENTWRPENVFERLDPKKLYDALIAEFSPIELTVDRQSPIVEKGVNCAWNPMMKSIMLANNLKTQYEIKHGFRFDLVIRTRWDVAYDPRKKFVNSLPDIMPTTLYARSTAMFFPEFRLPAIDDIMYFGSSRTMDIMDSFYNYHINGKFYEMVGQTPANPAYRCVGCGVLFHKWATLKNIFIQEPPHFLPPPVIRRSVANAKWPSEFDTIFNRYCGR